MYLKYIKQLKEMGGKKLYSPETALHYLISAVFRLVSQCVSEKLCIGQDHTLNGMPVTPRAIY